MKRKIISIGFEIPGHSSCFCDYSSSQSLLDADIVVFQPDFSCYDIGSIYRGKLTFNENNSFLIKEATKRWKSEILMALDEGKTIFVLMRKYEDVYVDTGKKETSGTGKNAKVTNIVGLYNNYEFLPVDIPSLIPKEGSELKLADGHRNLITTFWEEFKERIKYECYMDGEIEVPLFFTRMGNKPVGGLFRHGKGHLILLPPVNYSEEEFTEWKRDEKYREKKFWTAEALGFGKRLVRVLSDIDYALRNEASPPPAWIDEYKSKLETELTKKINSASKDIEKLQEKKDVLSDKLREERKLKNLLFETGKSLENAVIKALEILEYEVEDYRDGDLQIDQVISDPGGTRYIGETKGKNDAVKIDALRQLQDNIREDFKRKDITDPAVGILFGNGFRNTRPGKREEQFTDKSIRHAEETKTVLVRTSDLFEVASYVRESSDKEFAEKCREAILKNRGKIVKFPKVPTNVS